MGKYDKSRQALRAEAPERAPVPATKDRRKWCGGRAGRSHNIAIEVPPNYPGYAVGCQPAPAWWLKTRAGQRDGRDWWCAHTYRCTTCGKILDRLPGGLCPDRPKGAP